MAVADHGKAGPVDAKDDRSQKIEAELDSVISMQFPNETPLEDIIKYVRATTAKNSRFPEGIPIYVDPLGLQEADKSMTSPVAFDVKDVPLKTSLKLMLKQLGLAYVVRDGLLMITSQESLDEEDREGEARELWAMGETGGGMGGMGGGMGGMGGMGPSIEQAQAAGGTLLNQAAATDQARELRIADKENPPPPAGKVGPSVAFPIPGPLTIPSRQRSAVAPGNPRPVCLPNTSPRPRPS